MKKWIAGARLPTLPAAIVPVLVGTAAAGMPYHLGRAMLAAVVALALQVGVNFANDYSDGIAAPTRTAPGPYGSWHRASRPRRRCCAPP